MRVGFLFAVSFFLFLKSLYLFVVQIDMVFKLFVILQKYDFSSKSQQVIVHISSFSAVCDTAKVRFFKQITTCGPRLRRCLVLFVILQKYDFSSKSQPQCATSSKQLAVCDTAKVRFFKQITTLMLKNTAY